MLTGKVVYYSDYKGFGFIFGSDNAKYFVHVSQICDGTYRTLDVDDEVSFQPIKTRRGWQAQDVRILSSPHDKDDAPVTVSLKRNPFTPQDPVTDPAKFAGRRKSFISVVDSLYNGNNVLIHGPRGIGKSSLAYQIYYMTKGETEILEKQKLELEGFSFDYLTGDHRCVPGNSIYDIANGLISTMLMNLGIEFSTSAKEKEIGLSLNFLSGKEKTKLEKLSPSDLSTSFIADTSAIYKSQEGKCNGICFLIDEIDVLDDDVDIAPFLKATVEKLRLDYHLEAAFLLSGITGTTTTMVAQHPSSTRLLEQLEMKHMPMRELEEIIDRALDGTGVTITKEAKHHILELSNSFPHPVQLLGYHAFRIDDDDEITLDDVENAKRHVVENIKRQEFNEKFESLGAGPLTSIVRTFAKDERATTSINYIMQQDPHLTEQQVYDATSNLVKKGIIEKVSKGNYRLREPLFKIHLKWLFGIK